MHKIDPASFLMLLTEDFIPAFEKTTPQEAQQTPHLPPYSGSNQLSIPLMVDFIVLCVAVLLLVLGLFQCWKHRGTKQVLRRNLKHVLKCSLFDLE